MECDKHNVLTVDPLPLQNLLRKVTINTLAHSNENTGFFKKKDCVRHYVTIYDAYRLKRGGRLCYGTTTIII